MRNKVIVIGLDGLEPTILDRLLERNELPNFAKMRDGGHYGRVSTTYPAQTPVAWSSFVTGTNPGGHGIFDFISRDPQTYMPDMALSRFERPKNMLAAPRVVNRRCGVPLWQYLTQAGIPSIVLRCPVTFPAENLLGRMLAGVSVPDVRGSQGTGTFYTQNRAVQAKEHEQVIYLDAGQEIVTRIIGPRNTRTTPMSDYAAEIKVQVVREAKKIVITLGSGSVVEVPERAWSPWFRVKFKLSMLQSTAGIARLYCRQVYPHLEFYVSPVNFDPAAPMFPISFPADYGKTLSENIGLFSTLGMAEDHGGHNNDRFDAMAYKAQCDMVMEERERMLLYEMDRFSEGLLFMVFDTPDRLQHMFWRYVDQQHPNFDHDLARTLAPEIDDLYHRCDAIIGRVLERVDENTLLVVLSDHGFNSFQRAFDTNTWLWQNNLLCLKEGKQPNEVLTQDCVDWKKTYAYAVGLGGIYLNLKGRDRDGILEAGTGEAERVYLAIQQGLADFPDMEMRRPAIRSVARKEQLYSGPYVSQSPDLLVNFYPGYRVSWKSSIGGFGNALFENNTRQWSGDHIVDPEAVPGILCINRQLTGNHVRITDLAPTILNFLNVTNHPSMEGRPLLAS